MGRIASIIPAMRTESLSWDEAKQMVLKLLKKKKATMKEIEQELGLSPSYRGILALLLAILESEKLLKSEPLPIPVKGGVIMTRIFELCEEESPSQTQVKKPLEDPVGALRGLLRHVKKTGVELQHEARLLRER